MKKQIKENLEVITEELDKHLRKETKAFIFELLEAWEWGVAYEAICSEIEDYEITITQNQFNILKELGQAMKMDEEIYQDLLPYVK